MRSHRHHFCFYSCSDSSRASAHCQRLELWLIINSGARNERRVQPVAGANAYWSSQFRCRGSHRRYGAARLSTLGSMSTTCNYWRSVETMLRSTRCRSRIKWSRDSEVTDWTTFFIVPVDGYIEGLCGPIPVREVDWVDIDPIEIQEVGRLVPQRRVDHTAELVSDLTQHGIRYEQVEHGFRIYTNAA
jgi:hypothetical protein